MIYETDPLVHIEIGRYNDRKEYRVIISEKNINYLRANHPNNGKLVGKATKDISFSISLNQEGIVSNELGPVSVNKEREILLGNFDSLDKTISEFKQVPIMMPVNSDEKVLIGYVTLIRQN